MKKILTTTILTSFFFVLSLTVMASSEPGDPGAEPGSGDPPLGGGAPIGSGSLLLIGMAAAYGGYKTKKNTSNKES